MQFSDIINAKLSKERDRPLMQKDAFPVCEALADYLWRYNRGKTFATKYADLLDYSHSVARRDETGRLTHWETVIYDLPVRIPLYESILKSYGILHQVPETDFLVDRVDICEYGNSNPFRVVIQHQKTGTQTLLYIKQADASRIYGMELEALLSAGKLNYLYSERTLIEQHIPGIAGDDFLKNDIPVSGELKNKLAEAFIRFNERCFFRLLGDMRSYNFVVNLHQQGNQPWYEISPIDFDQQSYEGNKNLYFPQFYKENHEFVELVYQQFNPVEVGAIQWDEQKALLSRMYGNADQLETLLNCMRLEELSEAYKVLQLKKELGTYFQNDAYRDCTNMGEMVQQQLNQLKQVVEKGR